MSFHDLVLYAHIGTLMFAVFEVVYADELGLMWILGKRQTLGLSFIRQSHYIVYGALTIMLITGVWLFWPLRGFLLHYPLFYLKMGFVALLWGNSLAIDKLMRTATQVPFASLEPRQKLPFFISGALSSLGWLGAAVCGLYLFY